MSDLDRVLEQRLAEIKAAGLLRQLRPIDSPQSPRIRVNGRMLLNFSSNDYLGLANHPKLREAAVRAVEAFGAGSGGSRLICGSVRPHQELEERLAAFKGTEAALVFSTGFASALGAVTALVSKDDVVIVDRLVHASLIDAARLSGAKLRVFAHNDLDDLEQILKWAVGRHSPAPANNTAPRVLVITESVFSMDGDQAPLAPLAELKERYDAWLMVDEAHSTGLFGPDGRGLVAARGLTHRIEVQMGTLGKALGSSGGFIAGSRVLIDYLVNRARTFIFSTAPVPAASAAAAAAVALVQSSEGQERREKLFQLIRQLRLGSEGVEINATSAIVPVLLGKESRAIQVAERLLARGIFVPAIRYPTVARNQARLRLTMTAAHEPADVEELLAGLRSELSGPALPCEP